VLQAIVSTAPDIRVFNFSFDTLPLDSIDTVKRVESLSLVQDLDNFIFQNDVLVIVSAGNSAQRTLTEDRVAAQEVQMAIKANSDGLALPQDVVDSVANKR